MGFRAPLLALLVFVCPGCATGVSDYDGGPLGPGRAPDAGAPLDADPNGDHDSGRAVDSGNRGNDSGGGVDSAGSVDSGGGADTGCVGCNPCPSGQTLCSGTCVNTSSSPANCGTCGHSCGAGSNCVNGSCSVTCAAGTTNCGGVCVNTTNNPNNCGGCGVSCAGSACMAGHCCTGPPQGPCSHSLCASGAALVDGCDPTGCTSLICDGLGDFVCCDTVAGVWDATCVSEVVSFCGFTCGGGC